MMKEFCLQFYGGSHPRPSFILKNQTLVSTSFLKEIGTERFVWTTKFEHFQESYITLGGFSAIATSSNIVLKIAHLLL